MHISYKPLWHTLVERNMRKEDLRIAAGLTTNMIANMGKGCLLYTSPSPRDLSTSRMPSSA